MYSKISYPKELSFLEKKARPDFENLVQALSGTDKNKEMLSVELLIDDIKIEAIHSFEDLSYTVTKYKKLWGDEVGIIGGIDMDKLVRLNEAELRKYIREVLDVCINTGRYVFGSRAIPLPIIYLLGTTL